MHFKTLKEKPEIQYMLAAGLSCYKWYQSQTQGVVQTRTLDPREGEL